MRETLLATVYSPVGVGLGPVGVAEVATGVEAEVGVREVVVATVGVWVVETVLAVLATTVDRKLDWTFEMFDVPLLLLQPARKSI